MICMATYLMQVAIMCVCMKLGKHLPQQRRLSCSEKEAEKSLSLKANKKMIKDKLAAATGKAVILKDLSNIRLSMNAGNTRNDLSATAKKLTETYG